MMSRLPRIRLAVGASLVLILIVVVAGDVHARPWGKHQKVVTVQQQAPAVVYAGQAPTTAAPAGTVYYAYPSTAAAPAVTYPTVAAAPAMTYSTVAAAPATTYTTVPVAAAPATGSAPSETPCSLTADERSDIVAELREVKADNKDATPSERRQAVKDRATELVAEACEKDADDLSPSHKALVRSLVSEALTGNGRTWTSTTWAGAGPATCAAPYGACYQVVPLIPLVPLPPPPPKCCIHRIFGHCAKCCGRPY